VDAFLQEAGFGPSSRGQIDLDKFMKVIHSTDI